MIAVALKMLMGDRAKYIGLIFGIAFATLLMSQQVSIFFGILSRAASQIDDITEADIWVMDNQVKYIDEIRPMPDKNLYRVRSVPGVEWAVPLFKGLAMIRAEGGMMQQVMLMGVDDASLIGRPPKMIMGKWEDLKQPHAMIMDKAGFEFIWPNEKMHIGKVIEMNDRRVVIVGICEASMPFQPFPVVFTRYSEAINLTPGERNHLSFILAKAKHGKDIEQVKQRIHQETTLQATTNKEFGKMTYKYYLERTGIPINFGITVTLGFIIGAVIAGQTFYIFVIENLRQFGALKAIGVTNKQILRMVLAQAGLVAFIGYSIGIGLCGAFFYATSDVTALRGLYLPFGVVVGTAVAVIIIITIASLFSIRKVLVLDPATVFRN